MSVANDVTSKASVICSWNCSLNWAASSLARGSEETRLAIALITSGSASLEPGNGRC